MKLIFGKYSTYHEIRDTQDLCQANVHLQKIVPVQQIDRSVKHMRMRMY